MAMRKERKELKKEGTVKNKVEIRPAEIGKDAAQEQAWAVIPLGGAQQRVREGDTLTVNRVAEQPKQEFIINKVYLLFDGTELKVGQPEVLGAKVTFAVLQELRGDKIDVFKYKAKSRYRKRRGHRQELSRVKVLKIEWKGDH